MPQTIGAIHGMFRGTIEGQITASVSGTDIAGNSLYLTPVSNSLLFTVQIYQVPTLR